LSKASDNYPNRYKQFKKLIGFKNNFIHLLVGMVVTSITFHSMLFYGYYTEDPEFLHEVIILEAILSSIFIIYSYKKGRRYIFIVLNLFLIRILGIIVGCNHIDILGEIIDIPSQSNKGVKNVFFYSVFFAIPFVIPVFKLLQKRQKDSNVLDQ
jgi:hypothetical protein